MACGNGETGLRTGLNARVRVRVGVGVEVGLMWLGNGDEREGDAFKG